MNEELVKKLLQDIQTMANEDGVGDDPDFCASDYSGGNYDDAYSLGCDDGEIYYARELRGRYSKLFENL